ncbi:protein S-acyltransferase 8-like isoform X2 [Vicia villosa]|uniref:protein S-acyltransferase 8-like isoform X2 n=1 Tax=Vicia villosa TaxID=3911 RepID=UPI00273C454D|nr:protein S-acyltransferase 8-like isoform X2 [Vicia villosa]
MAAKRVYQVWKGSNKFIFGGRLAFGPDARSLIITFSLIIVPVIIFCAFVARHLRHEFSSYYSGYAILVAAILFTIHVLVLLSLTSARDPGIVPRNSHPPEEEFRYESSGVGGQQTPTLQFPRTKEVMVNGITVKRNYRYFFLFVSSATILCVYVFSLSAYYIKVLMDNDNNGTVWKAIKDSPASVILMAYCFISLWFVGGLTGFHLYLIGSNQTTYENFRYRADGRINVFNRGCINNFLEVFCTEIKPSRNNFRAFVQEEGQRPLTPVFARGHEQGDLSGDRRPKVEHDLDIGEDLLKISQRRNIEELDEDIRSRGSNGAPHITGDPDSILSSDHRATTIRSDTRHSRWERSGSWEIAQDDFANSNVTESRNHVTSKEMRQ